MGCTSTKEMKAVRPKSKAIYIMGDQPVDNVCLPQLAPTLPPLEDPDHLLLFELLQQPSTQALLGEHASAIGQTKLLMCWADIEELKNENVRELALSRSVDIYGLYINRRSPYCLQNITDLEIKRYDRGIEACIVGGACNTNDLKYFFAEVTLLP
jgi:hypothetical protein